MEEPFISADSILTDLSDKNHSVVKLLNSIMDGIYVVDRDRKILFWNNSAEKMTGYDREEILNCKCGINLLNHIDKKGNVLCLGRCPVENSLREGDEIRTVVYPRHKDGRRFPVETNISPVRDNSGKIVGAIEVFRDISSEEEYRILLEKFNKLIKKYVSNATYKEVRNRISGEMDPLVLEKDMTILYLDVVGFSSFSEEHSPRESAELLNDLFGICEVITLETHGDIDKFIGDSIMAVFFDANDAVKAGMQILKALSRLNQNRREEGQADILIRIGINSGIVIQGEIGTSDRKDLTVIGDVVNTASRIESASSPMDLCISEATYSRLNYPELFLHLKQIRVKNKKNPINIYHLNHT